MACVDTIVGLDLSLTAAGMCALPFNWGGDWEKARFGLTGYTLASKTQAERIARIVRVTEAVERFVAAQPGKVTVFIEGYAFSKRTTSATKLAELGGAVRFVLGTELGIIAEEMTASRARAYVLGKLPQKDQKAITQATVREFCPLKLTGDEVDAFVVANAGVAELGGVGLTLASCKI
jgi:hypothetical protein